MKFSDCFTIDYYARTGKKLSFGEWLWELIFDPGFRVVVYYRVALFLKTLTFPRRTARIFGDLILMRLIRVPGVEFRTLGVIGEGLHIYHPHDIVIGKGVKIGKNVTIFNGVTLGARTLLVEDDCKDNDTRYPIIGNNVTIFPGAKIFGPVTIGDNCIVGANSVVNRSFPADSIIAGSPARFIRIRG
jgi:serine O-acetyltransferase